MMFTITIDPLAHFKLYGNDERCNEVLNNHQFLIDWATSYNPDDSNKTLFNHLADCYGFPMPLLAECEITPSGVWRYPGDPDLYPLLWLSFGSGQEFIIYPHALVAIRESSQSPWACTRMD